MLRITKLVGKIDIFTLLNNPDVCKVEMLQSENKTLTNPDVCRVNLYLRIDDKELFELITRCKNAKKKGWKDVHVKFVSGLGGIYQNRFIKWSQVRKLKEIENGQKTDFAIPEIYTSMVAKYAHYIDG